MKIVVLDGFTENPGDLSWEWLQQYGEVKIYERTKAEQVYERAKDAEIIIANKIIFDKVLLKSLNKLKYIGIIAAGFNTVDLETAREMQITVTNTPNYGSRTVAQMVFAHLLEITNNVGYHTLSVKEGEWSECLDFCYWKRPIISLENKIIGILGYGNIGKEVAKLAIAFGMKVLVYDIKQKEIDNQVTLDEIFSQSDVLSLHLPLTDETKYLINRDTINKMKKGVILINTSRGQLINEKDLLFGIEKGIIYSAGLDVLENEPPEKKSKILEEEKINITPHIAWASVEARKNIMSIAENNLKSFLEGKICNKVN